MRIRIGIMLVLMAMIRIRMLIVLTSSWLLLTFFGVSEELVVPVDAIDPGFLQIPT
jgi:hypothetical protein